jgi:hypothetical protein
MIEAMSTNMVTKFDKYWFVIQGLMGIATILDPRFKNLMLLMSFEWFLGTFGKVSDDKVVEVKYLLSQLMLKYHLEDVEEENGCETSTAATLGNTNFLSSFRPPAMRSKSELDRYLEDDLVSLSTKNFNILDWWKVEGTCYPTLRRITRDIFTIHVTTVASESAFSTSGRVLSEDRSRLTSQMLEALMCSQNWIRNKYKGISVCPVLIFLFGCNLIYSPFLLLVDEKERNSSTFWSCLQDIQEGLHRVQYTILKIVSLFNFALYFLCIICVGQQNWKNMQVMNYKS